MPVNKTKLEYIDPATGNWVRAVTSEGNDAIIMVTVDQGISAAAKADILVSNRSSDPTSGDPAEATGPLTNVFADFQRIRLIQQEKGIPIFSGRIYRIRDRYDMQYGQTIRITAFDSLKELREFPIEGTASELKRVNTTSSDTEGYDLRKRSELIKYMLDKLNLKDKNMITTDVNHFEESWSIDSLKDKRLNLTKMDRNVAGVMFELAVSDPINELSASSIGESGYDYRVEPRWVSSANTSKPPESLHYFMRGTRPGKGGAYGNADTPILAATAPEDSSGNPLPLITDSLTIEYNSRTSVPDSGIKQTMMPTYEFDKPKEELYTSVVCHYTDEGREDASSDDEGGGRKEGVVTFELLKGSTLSGTFTWATKTLDPSKVGVVNVPEYLTYGDPAVNVARVQWQNTDKKYLLISHINEDTFPTANENVTLTGAISGSTFVFNAATERMKNKYGVERPVRIQRTLTSDLGMLRDEIVTRIVGRTDLEIVRGKFQTLHYPTVYHDLVNTATPPASTASRSSNTITWTDSISAKDRGIRVGHIVAEVDASGEHVRYAYISVINNDRSITYGANETDTSDGTALLASNTIRLIVPLRPGDVIKVVNATSNISSDQLILTLGYDEFVGVFSTRFETVGSNNNFNNIYLEAEEIRALIALAMPKKYPESKSLGEIAFLFDGYINRGSNPSDLNDYRKIHWTNAASDTSGTAGILTSANGDKYTIACANSPILTTAEHVIFFRPTTASSTNEALKSDTKFQVVLRTSYTEDPDDIYVGWCKASTDKSGAKAVLELIPQILSKNLFSSGQNGTLTEALLSKSAQEYSSGLEITPVTSGSNRHQQVTWAACTSTSGSDESPDDRLTFGDGDLWNIAVKSGSNYTVTSNGTTFTNITELATSSTYYAFVDTDDTASGGTLTLRFTTKYSHISSSTDGATFFSSRVLLAQIAVPANSNDGASPRIFPFNNRSLTINAASIAADSITATHITATAIDTTHLKLTGDDGIGGITSAGNLNLTNTEGSLSLDNTTDSTSGDGRKAATTAQITAANAAALGLDQTTGHIKKNVVVDGVGSSPTFYSWSGSGESDPPTPGNLVVVNAQGIAGYTNVTGTYNEGSGTHDGLTLPSSPRFEIRSTDGRAAFGGGNVTADENGLTIDNSVAANGTSFLTFKGNAVMLGGNGESKCYKIKIDNGYPAGTILMGAGDSPPSWHFLCFHNFITNPNPWIGFGQNNRVTIGNPGSSTTSDGIRGIYFDGNHTEGGNDTIPLPIVNKSGILYMGEDGHLHFTNKFDDSTATHGGFTTDDGSDSTPSYTFNNDKDSGLYYDSGPCMAFGGNERMSWETDRVTCHADLHIGTSGTDDLYVNDIRATGSVPFCGIPNAVFTNFMGIGLSLTGHLITMTGLGEDTAPANATILKIESDGTLVKEASSRRYKENIVDLDIDTSKIFDLVPRSFKFKDRIVEIMDDETREISHKMKVGKESFGLIAEEVNEQIPELVILNNNGEPEAVDYVLISILLLAELKKLKTRIEVLEEN